MWTYFGRAVRGRDVNGLLLVLFSLVVTVAATTLTKADSPMVQELLICDNLHKNDVAGRKS